MSLPKELIKDPSLRRLMAHHASHAELLHLEAAYRVKSLAPDDEFVISQYLLGIKYFEDRISSVFEDRDTFLDVGCGAGNWTIAAASIFDHALGIDIHEKRLSIAKQMASELLPSPTILFLNTSADKLPLADASITAILCNNVMALLNIPHEAFLLELQRVAANGCKIYLTATDSGYLLWLCIQALRRPNLRRFWSFGEVIARNLLFLLGLRAQPYAWMDKKYIVALAERCGWRLQYFGPEGALISHLQLPLFKRTYFGLPLMKEYIFTRPV